MFGPWYLCPLRAVVCGDGWSLRASSGLSGLAGGRVLLQDSLPNVSRGVPASWVFLVVFVSGGGCRETKPYVSLICFCLARSWGPPLAFAIHFSVSKGVSQEWGAPVPSVPCAFLSCFSGAVQPSARMLLLPQNGLFLGATLALLSPRLSSGVAFF